MKILTIIIIIWTLIVLLIGIEAILKFDSYDAYNIPDNRFEDGVK